MKIADKNSFNFDQIQAKTVPMSRRLAVWAQTPLVTVLAHFSSTSCRQGCARHVAIQPPHSRTPTRCLEQPASATRSSLATCTLPPCSGGATTTHHHSYACRSLSSPLVGPGVPNMLSWSHAQSRRKHILAHLTTRVPNMMLWTAVGPTSTDRRTNDLQIHGEQLLNNLQPFLLINANDRGAVLIFLVLVPEIIACTQNSAHTGTHRLWCWRDSPVTVEFLDNVPYRSTCFRLYFTMDFGRLSVLLHLALLAHCEHEVCRFFESLVG